MDEAKEKLKNIFCLYLWFLLQGFGLQGSLEIHDPNSNWLSWSPTQRAMHALGYVRPFWPQTGTNWSTQLQGRPAGATQNRDWVHTHFPRHKIQKESLRHLCLQPLSPTCHLAMLDHKQQEGKFVSCPFAHSTQLSPFFP